MAREHRPWNSDSESSESVVMSEDTDQVIIESLSTEIQTLKKIIRVLLEKDEEKTQRIKDLQNIIMTRTGNDTTGKVLTFL
jgi:chaperonin cofactor prefoldin